MSRVSLFAACVLIATFVGAAPGADAPDGAAERRVTLERRKDNGAYKSAAYSFRKASADEAVHRNYVDVLHNGCGSLHVNMVNGQENRVCDLGATNLKDAPDAAPADAAWFTTSVKPQAGHVYLQEVKQNGQTMTVKYLVEEVTEDAVRLTWMTVKKLEGPDDGARRGKAGRNGQCGEPHKDK